MTATLAIFVLLVGKTCGGQNAFAPTTIQDSRGRKYNKQWSIYIALDEKVPEFGHMKSYVHKIVPKFRQFIDILKRIYQNVGSSCTNKDLPFFSHLLDNTHFSRVDILIIILSDALKYSKYLISPSILSLCCLIAKLTVPLGKWDFIDCTWSPIFRLLLETN